MRQRLTVALALALAGCNVTPHKAYDGPARRDAELSFLKGGSRTAQTDQDYSPVSVIDLRVIDGAPQRVATYYASVLPGGHVIGISDKLTIGMRDRIQYCSFELETAAGCTYIPAAPSPPAYAGKGSWEWNVDMVVTAECAGTIGFQLRAPARCASSDQVFERASK